MVLSSGAPEERERVRIAIDGCADEEMRALLERAAEGEVEEAALLEAERRAAR
jgi:hypothetical protein